MKNNINDFSDWKKKNNEIMIFLLYFLFARICGSPSKSYYCPAIDGKREQWASILLFELIEFSCWLLFNYLWNVFLYMWNINRISLYRDSPTDKSW